MDEEIAAKILAGADSVFIRIKETGSVDIWD